MIFLSLTLQYTADNVQWFLIVKLSGISQEKKTGAEKFRNSLIESKLNQCNEKQQENQIMETIKVLYCCCSCLEKTKSEQKKKFIWIGNEIKFYIVGLSWKFN